MPGSLADIARSLNVSVSLVSKVLSGRMGTTNATPEAVAAIHAYARKIGYVKNPSASGLATGRQNVIGVYIHYHGAPGSALSENMVMGISGETFACQQRLMLTYFTTLEEFEFHTRNVATNLVDSMIVGGLTHPDLEPTLRRIQSHGVRIITIMDVPGCADFPNIGVNQVDVGATACRHLIDRGCKRLAHINVMPDRYLGFRQALDERGIPFDPELVYHPESAPVPPASYSYEAGVLAIQFFIERKLQFDGLVAQSDLQAVGAMHTLLKLGRRVPEDVRVIGIDNSPYCGFSVVPLSSVSQQDQVRGSLAVQYLMKTGAEWDKIPPPAVAPVLYPRESTR